MTRTTKLQTKGDSASSFQRCVFGGLEVAHVLFCVMKSIRVRHINEEDAEMFQESVKENTRLQELR
jgi:hypothetical protein